MTAWNVMDISNRRPYQPGEREDLDEAAFKAAMRLLPTGVCLITTTEDSGIHHGFTAGAVASLSMKPPLILVCLARSASCFRAFSECASFAVNVVAEGDLETAVKFATSGVDKFSGSNFTFRKGRPPIYGDAVMSVECERYNIHPGGDHIILVGRIVESDIAQKNPLVYMNGRFRVIADYSPAVAVGA